ncbi:hypothetical protein [Kurthia sp. Dielmo]|uniref:hypothetical protein n=1 Tax=Kurthia sp. Dielmo TaxID=1033738 RepID=UPI00111DD54E|nr:hypothetical protein [Kurthia sp. Dielmo]
MKKKLEAELKPIMLTEQEIERIVRETQTVTKPSRKPMLISVVWVATALLFFVLLLPTFTPALHTGATVAFNWWYAIVALFFLSHIVYIYLLRRVKQTIYCPSCGEELSERYLRKKNVEGKNTLSSLWDNNISLANAQKNVWLSILFTGDAAV